MAYPCVLTCLASVGGQFKLTLFLVSLLGFYVFFFCLPWDSSQAGMVLHQALSVSLRMLNPFASGWPSKVCDLHVLQNLCLAGAGWREHQALRVALMDIVAITISFLSSNNCALFPGGFDLGYHF